MKKLDLIISESINRVIKEVIENELTVYHGTPYNFIKFQNKNIGSGEGSQSFGWGLYFTANKSVAEYYAKMLKKDVGYVYTVKIRNGHFFEWYKKLDEGFKRAFVQKMHEMGYDKMPYRRMLVKGKIDTQYLSVEEAVDYFPNGKFFYENVGLLLGGAKEASAFLNELGFCGIKYPVGTFMKDKWSDIYGYNYVIFNGDDAHIIDKKEV